jgi:hypothetical protein
MRKGTDLLGKRFPRNTLARRIFLAILLNGQLYTDIKNDPTATLQALGVIVLGSVSFALSWTSLITPFIEDGSEELLFEWGGYGTLLPTLLAWSFTASIVGWIFLSLLAYLGTQKLFGKNLTFPIVLRGTGFGSAPAILWLLGFGGRGFVLILNPVIIIWIVLSMTVALKHTLSISWLSSLWLSMIGFVFAVMILNLVARPFW